MAPFQYLTIVVYIVILTDHAQLIIIAKNGQMSRIAIIMPAERPENVSIYGYIIKLWP